MVVVTQPLFRFELFQGPSPLASVISGSEPLIKLCSRPVFHGAAACLQCRDRTRVFRFLLVVGIRAALVRRAGWRVGTCFPVRPLASLAHVRGKVLFHRIETGNASASYRAAEQRLKAAGGLEARRRSRSAISSSESKETPFHRRSTCRTSQTNGGRTTRANP